MAKAEAAHDEARAAALAEEKAAKEAASEPETPSPSPDSDDEDLAAPFKRTPFEEWCKAQVRVRGGVFLCGDIAASTSDAAAAVGTTTTENRLSFMDAYFATPGRFKW